MGLALEKDAEECYSVDMNDAVRHGMCVSVLASELARELGCDEEFIHKVAVAGMLHDVGKLQVSPYIYGRRQGAMKIEEMRYVRLHAKLGAEILKREGYDQDIVDMVHYHHENYDGSISVQDAGRGDTTRRKTYQSVRCVQCTGQRQTIQEGI